MKSRVEEIMTPGPKTCRASDYLSTVAELMWEHDMGCVPVVDDRGRLVGVITDRDVCMAAYTQGLTLYEIPVLTVMAKKAVWVRRDDDVEVALERMREAQVRRLPVIDVDWQVVGLISINDLIREARPANVAVGITDEAVIKTLRAIGRRRTARELVKRPILPPVAQA
jgi:CBS domain-containing protein